MFRNIARHFDNRGLDQHLRAALVQFRDQGGKVGLHLLAGAHDHCIRLYRRLNGDVFYRKRGHWRGHKTHLWGLFALSGCHLFDGQSLGHRIADRAARSDQPAQHFGHGIGICIAQFVDARDRHSRRNGLSADVKIGDDALHHFIGFAVRFQQQNIGARIDRDLCHCPFGGRAVQNTFDCRPDGQRIGIPDLNCEHLLPGIGIKGAGDPFNPAHVFGGVGDHKRVGINHSLDIAKTCDQRAQRANSGRGWKILQLHQSGYDIQPSDICVVPQNAATFANGRLWNNPPKIAGWQRCKTLH